MRLQSTDDPTVAYVKLPAQLVVGNRQTLKQEVLDKLGTRHLIVDASDTGFIDMSGLGVMVSLRQSLYRDGLKLVIASPTPDIKDLFEFTKLDVLFDTAETTELALVRLQATDLPGLVVTA